MSDVNLGIICPSCSAIDNGVIDSRPHVLGRWRRHRCSCGFRFTTIEMVLPDSSRGVPAGDTLKTNIVNSEKIRFAKQLLFEAQGQ